MFYFRPDLIDFNKITKAEAEQNLEQAFEVAETQLGITPLLDPEGKTFKLQPTFFKWFETIDLSSFYTIKAITLVYSLNY